MMSTSGEPMPYMEAMPMQMQQMQQMPGASIPPGGNPMDAGMMSAPMSPMYGGGMDDRSRYQPSSASTCAGSLCGCGRSREYGFVGEGSGDYMIETTYRYVGKGKGDMMPAEPPPAPPPKTNWCRNIGGFAGIMLLVGLVVWVVATGSGASISSPGQSTSADATTNSPPTSGFLVQPVALTGPDTMEDEGYNCMEDYTDCYSCLLRAWSPEKITFCCNREGKGCPTTTAELEYDCTAGNERVEDSWSREKRIYCCQHAQIGCITQM